MSQPNQDWQMLIEQAAALTQGETNLIANLANLSAVLNEFLDQVNWCGFYLVEQEQLENFRRERKPGVAASTNQTQRVADVHAFEGHIVCDAASESEIVLPIALGDQVVAVLDIDSPLPISSRIPLIECISIDTSNLIDVLSIFITSFSLLFI